MINQGERDEYLVKLRLIQLRDMQEGINMGGEFKGIESVGFNGIEYRQLPQDCDLKRVESSANKGDMRLLEQLCDVCRIKKTGTREKADVFINGKGFSIKSRQSAPPAIVNHTPRNGWVRIANEKNVSIGTLDSIIAKYWDLRKAGIIKEDTGIGDEYCPFNGYKDELKVFLEYFLYEGTGSAKSKVPAEAFLEFSKPLDERTWEFSRNEYYDKIWERLVFSIRDKGMHPQYPNCKDAKLIAPWTNWFQGSYKGSLHVRVR